MQWNGIDASVRGPVSEVETVDFAATLRAVRIRRRAEQAVALVGLATLANDLTQLPVAWWTVFAVFIKFDTHHRGPPLTSLSQSRCVRLCSRHANGRWLHVTGDADAPDVIRVVATPYCRRRLNVGKVTSLPKAKRGLHFRSAQARRSNLDALPFNLDRHVFPRHRSSARFRQRGEEPERGLGEIGPRWSRTATKVCSLTGRVGLPA
jgi:hypothetical protein